MASMHGDRNVRGRFGHRARVRGAAIIAAMAGCASCASGDIIQWLSAASGLWSNPSMWEDGNVPNNLNDVAYIGKLGSSYTITVDFDVPMEALTLNSPNATIALNGNRWMYVAAVNPDSFCHIEQGAFNITGGATLKCDREIAVTNPNAVLTMNNGAVEGGVLEINDGGLVSVNTTGYLRTSRTLISDTGQLRVTDGSVVLLDHPGHILEGTGEVLLNGSYYGSRMELRQDAVNAGNIRLSNHPSNSLSGQNLPAADFVLINHGLIHGAGAVGQNTTTFTNTLTGAIIADVSTALYLDPGPAGMLNDGLLGATAGGTLYLQGATYDSSAPGEATIHADNGSRVILNTSAVAVGHTLSTSGTGVIDLSGATLTDDGVNMTHIPGFVRIMDGTAGYFAGAFDLTGDISLASSYYGSVMSMSGDSYFSGGGVVTLANHSGGAVTSTPAHVHWLTNASCTFRGAGQFGANTLGIENLADGTIEAAGSAGLTINPSDVLGLRNEGLLRALGGSSLTLTGAGFDNTGGVVHAADGGRVYLSAAQVTGGSMTTGGSGRIVNSASNSVLRDVTSSGVMDINDGVTTRFESTFTNSGLLSLVGSYYGAVMYIQGGNVLLNGGGTVALSNHPSNVVMAASGELVLTNQDNLITGSGSLGSNQLRIVNNATIEGSASYPLIINPTDAGGVDNNGVLRAAPGGKLFLDGPGFDNQQGVIHADDAGLVNLRSATVIGGQLTASGTGSFTTGASNSLLRDVASSAPVNIPDGVTTRFESSFHNDGTLTLQGSYYGALMYVQGGSVALTGGGSVLLSNHPSNQVTGDGASSTLINQSNLISGSGSLGSNVIGIINNSVIEGSGSYGLVINPADGAGLDNNATLRAADGGRLFLDGPGFDNAGGVIRAENGGTVYLRTASISGGRLTGAGTGVFVNSGSNSLLSNVSVEAPFVINDGTNLTLAGAVGVSSTMTANSSYYGATVTIQNSVTLDGGGTLVMGNHPSSLISGNTGAAVLTNSGVTIRGSGQLGANQLVIVNGPGGTMRADQAYALTINPSAGGFTNQGALQVAAGATMNIGDGGFTTSGSITVDAGGKLDKTSESFTQTGGSVHAHGEIEVDSNSYLLQGGTLGGRGLVDSNVINSGGVISPGASTGTLTIEGNLLQQESAEMHIEVGGGNTGEYDTLKVLGSASLNGVLRLTNLNGFIADPGQQFTVVNSTGVMSGTFSQIIQPTTGPRWGVAYINNSVILTAFCGADFDGTGFVDTDDFTAFVTAFEAGTDDADFDGTGFVDTDDFTAFVIAFEAGC